MVEHVFPAVAVAVAVRQWVVVFPKRVRYFLNMDAGCLNRVAGIVMREVQRATAGASTSTAPAARSGGVVSKGADECFMPLTAGGGVRSLADFRKLLLAGADKVSINMAAVENPGLITEAARQFGAQCVVVSIDSKAGASGCP